MRAPTSSRVHPVVEICFVVFDIRKVVHVFLTLTSPSIALQCRTTARDTQRCPGCSLRDCAKDGIAKIFQGDEPVVPSSGGR